MGVADDGPSMPFGSNDLPLRDAPLRVAIASDWYPSAERPVGGIFVEDQAAAFQNRFPVVVIAPVRVSWRSLRRSRAHGRPGGRDDPVPVRRPRVLLLPRAADRNDRAYESVVERSLEEAARTIGPVDVINAHVVLPMGLAAARVGRRLGLPVVITEHSSPFAVHVASLEGRRRTEEALCMATRVVAVSPALRDQIRAVVDIPVDVVGNVVASPFFEAALPTRPRAIAPRILAVGFLVRQKRFDILLRAVQAVLPALPDLELVIVGTGPEDGALRSLARQLGLSGRVRFAAMTDRPGLVRWLGWADALVSSSDHESFGLVVAETLAAGRPVVTTASGGPESYVDEDLGLVVPAGDVDALAGALATLPAFISSFRPEAARERMAGEFGAAAFADRMQRIFHDVVATPRTEHP